MNSVISKRLLILFAYLLAPLALAEPSENYLLTEELQPVVGHQESALGARVDRITETQDGVEITLSLPQAKEDPNNGLLEEVIVLGKPPQKNLPRPKLPQLKRYKLINNLEEGRSGLVLYLGKQENFVLRLNYSDDNDESLQNLLEP